MVLIKNSLCFNYVYDLMNVNYDDAMNVNEYTNMEYIYTFNEIKFKEEIFLQYVNSSIVFHLWKQKDRVK